MATGLQEHLDYEANAQYDHIREAYAATALDPYEEGYCSYAFDCEDQGIEPQDFAEWKATLRRERVAPMMPVFDSYDEVPF